MKPHHSIHKFNRWLLPSLLLLTVSAHAADGTWNVDANGVWSTAGNWTPGIADGSGFTANFTNNITADRTVSLDSDRTLTNVVFGDSDTATAGSWILNNNGTAANNLILSGGTPTITVNALGTAKTATISAIIEGSAGMTKAGIGTLVLSGANAYTGGTTLSAGVISVGNNAALSSGTITLSGGGLNTSGASRILTNAIVATAATTSALIADGGNDLVYKTGTVTGSGTLSVNSTTGRSVWLQGDGSGFTGTISYNNVTGGTNLRLGGTDQAQGIGTNGSDWSQAKFFLTGATASSRELSWNGLAGATVKIGELSGTGGLLTTAGVVTTSAANFEIGHLNTSAVFDGVIATGHSITKVGTGSLTLGGATASTFTGNVSVNAGTLVIGKASALGTSNTAATKVTVASGAMVNFNGIADARYGYTISGTGISAAGALVNNGTAISTGNAQASNITLAANASIGGSGNWALLAGGHGATTLNLGGFTLTKSGANIITLATTTTTAGAIQVSAGTLAFGTASGGSGVVGAASSLNLADTSGVALSVNLDSSIGSLAGGGAAGGSIAIAAAKRLTVGALGTNTSFAGVISGGTGAITKVGSGSLTLAAAGANTYGSGTIISNGTLIGTTNNAAFGAGSVTLGDANTGVSNVALFLGDARAITNNVIVSASGSGTATIGTTDSAPGANSNFGGTLTLNRATTLQAGSTDRTTFSGVISGTGNLTVASPFANNRRVVITGGVTNTFVGSVTIANNAQLQIGVASAVANRAIPDASAIRFENSVSNLRIATTGTSDTETVGSLVSLNAGAGAVNLSEASTGFNLSIGADNANANFSGTITNSGAGSSLAITKVGSGIQTLSGTNTYVGATTVSAGTLAINGNQAAATGAVGVSGTGTRLIGTGTVGGTTTINSGAIQSAGGAVANVDKVGLQTFGVNRDLAFGAGSIFEWDLNANKDTDTGGVRGTDFDAINGSGTGNVTVDSTAIFRVVLGSTVAANAFWTTDQAWSNIFSGFTSTGSFANSLLQVVDTAGASYDTSTLNPGGSFSVSGTTLNWTAVPEPSSALAGLLIAAGLLRRRRQN